MKRLFIAIIVFPLVGQVLRAQADAPKSPVKYDLTPLMLDSRMGGSTLGLNYSLSQEKPLKTFGSDEASTVLDPSPGINQLAISWEAKGTATAVAERNPRDFLEFSFDGLLLHSGTAGTFRFGPDVRYEADQAFDNTQTVVGGALTWGKADLLGLNSFIGLSAKYGQVDPARDTVRANALGSTTASYARWNFEGLYMLPLTFGPVRALEVNARLFIEPNAASAIRAVGLDEHRVLNVRVALERDLFVGYSTGKLPFDQSETRVMTIGWSYKLK